MQFAIALPWWALMLVAAAACAAAWGSYAGAIVPLARRQRAILSTLRAATLLVLVACLLRPVRVMSPDAHHDAVVPVLVDVSRSMRLADAGGRARIDVARDLVRRTLVPALSRKFAPEVWTFGDALTQARADAAMTADASRSDLSGALHAIRDRYRERRVAGVVVISDGGDTGAQDAGGTVDADSVPVYTVGVGSATGGSDREVLDVTAGEASLAGSSIDLAVSAVSRGSASPFDVRVLENGRPIDLRRLTPVAPGSPVHAVFTVSPPHDAAAVYTAEIPAGPGEVVVENNRRSLLVEPPDRRRRVLMVEGAPGFEQAFMKRALAADPALEVDSTVRKGRDLQGDATYLVQAAADRAPQLASGFPKDRESLDRYDAVILANVEPDTIAHGALESLASFVGDRGGGLLVLGARSFAQQGFVGTPVEQVLPVAVSGRSGGIVLTSATSREHLQVRVTGDGESHPIMRLGATADETAKRWRALPALFGLSPLGAARPGALVLAVVDTPEGQRPLIAVQRYGQGRSMVFAGEASWHWRMQMPSADNTYDLFWRQAVRWLSRDSPDPVAVDTPDSLSPGDPAAIDVDVRNGAFEAITDAQVVARVTAPGGETSELHPTLADARTGRYAAEMRFADPGVYAVAVEARRGGVVLGRATRSMLVGGVDREMADPRLNDQVLRRVSRASGGGYLEAADALKLPSLLASMDATPPAPRVQELWHSRWIFAALILLLATEWSLRRQWGLR